VKLRIRKDFEGRTFQTTYQGVPLVLTRQAGEYSEAQGKYLWAIWGAYLEGADDTPPPPPEDDRRLICGVCGRRFIFPGRLRNHKKLKHGKDRK
jgi:hypothetical protein